MSKVESPEKTKVHGSTRTARTRAAAAAVETFTPRIETEIAGIRFQNPVWTASGTFGYAKEFAHLIDLDRLGAVCVKGISADPMEGNPEPRIYETASGMLNAIGLQNVGAKRFLSEKLPLPAHAQDSRRGERLCLFHRGLRALHRNAERGRRHCGL